MNILTLYTSGTRRQRFYIKPEDSGVYMKKLNLEIDGNLTVSGTTSLNVSNVVTNLVSTGDIIARNLVYNIGNQTISGIKTFSEGVFGSNLVYNTGNQTISGIKTFANDINASGTGTFAGLNLENINSLLLSGMRITITGNSTIDVANAIRISGNPVLTGIDLSSYATITNLASTGSTLQTNINNLSGVSVLTFGNQLINGTKTFNSGVVINVQPTGTNPALYITGTWNNASEIYTGIHLDITDTNSNSTSTFLNLRTNGTSRLRIRKDGAIFGRDGTFGSDDGFSFGDQAGGAISFYSAGTETFRVSRNVNPAPGVQFTRPLGGMTFSEGHALYSQGTNIIGQANGINPQSFRVFNSTGTNSGEFGLVGWINSGFVVGAQNTNSGILRDTIITGNNISLRSANLDANGYINLSNPQRFRIRSDTNGMFAGRDGGDSMNLTAQGHRILLRSDGSISWSNSTSNLDQYAGDTFIGRDAQGIIAQRDGVNPQQFRVYNSTGTNSGEFALFGWRNSGLVIGPQQTTSGILRDLTLTGNNININASGVLNIFDNTNIVGNLTVSGNTTITGHLSASSKSFLIDHPTQIGKKLQYGSLESPYHGIRLTDKNKLIADSVKVNLPDYISELVNDEKVNIQLTNINHDKILFVKDVKVNENHFTVAMNRGWFDKNEYEFYWSFTAERKDIPKLTVEF